MSDFSDRPLVADCLYGARSFNISSEKRLEGVSGPVEWEPGVNHAICDYSPTVDHGAPNSDCTCGFYAYFKPKGKFLSKGTVKTVVRGWGRAVVGSKGFRCEKAEVVALVKPGIRSASAPLWECSAPC